MCHNSNSSCNVIAYCPLPKLPISFIAKLLATEFQLVGVRSLRGSLFIRHNGIHRLMMKKGHEPRK